MGISSEAIDRAALEQRRAWVTADPKLVPLQARP